MDAPLIDVRSLCRGFDGRPVLRGLDFQVAAGTVYGVVGRNGAGKTTLIRVLLGLLRPESGTVSVLGHDPWRHEPAYYRSVGAVLEHDGFFGNLTFVQNIAFYAEARRVARSDLERYLLEFWADLEVVRTGQRARDFSRGQRMQCALCRAFLGWPRVCFLDEPTVGLDIDSYDHFRTLVREARSRGSAVVVSSHNLSAIEELCDTVGLLKNGVLRTIARKDSQRQWFVIVDGGTDDAIRATVVQVGGTVLECGSRWLVEVADPRQAIPLLVELLVRSGVRVREVRPAASDLEYVIRGDRQQGTGPKGGMP